MLQFAFLLILFLLYTQVTCPRTVLKQFWSVSPYFLYSSKKQAYFVQLALYTLFLVFFLILGGTYNELVLIFFVNRRMCNSYFLERKLVSFE